MESAVGCMMKIAMSSGNTDTFHFLKQWNQGDRKGLESLLKDHLPWLHAQVRKRMGPLLRVKGETCDYVQDAVVEFLRYGPRFTLSDDAVFRALMLKIVENALRHKHEWFTAQRRNIAREHPLPSDTLLCLDPPQGPMRTPSRSAERNEQEAWIRLGLEFLEPENREVLILRKWKTLSFVAMGEHLGISSNAARKRHNRALDRLTQIIWDVKKGKLSLLLAKERHDA